MQGKIREGTTGYVSVNPLHTASWRWESPPENVGLREKHVDLWVASLNVKPGVLHELRGFLSNDEIARSRRFSIGEIQNNYITARGLLRLLVSRYLDIEPDEVVFQYDIHGKPLLAPGNAKALHFNISHSHGMVLYGFADNMKIGVDIEKVRTDIPFEKIAQRQFSSSEMKLFQGMSESEKLHTFFTLWTRKEAVLKAVGTGLRLPMSQIDVSETPSKPALFLKQLPDGITGSVWFTCDVAAIPGYKAAFAADERYASVNLYMLEP